MAVQLLNTVFFLQDIVKTKYSISNIGNRRYIRRGISQTTTSLFGAITDQVNSGFHPRKLNSATPMHTYDKNPAFGTLHSQNIIGYRTEGTL